jgi:toxin YxiD
MKVLDVKDLYAGVDHTLTEMNKLQALLFNIQKAIVSLVSLDGLKGKGGEAIKSFFAECHLPFLAYMDQFLSNYKQALNRLKQAVHSFESREDGFISQEFLENDVDHGLEKVKTISTELTNEVNHLIRSVQDIVSLPQLDQSELINSVQHGKKITNETIDQLHALDLSQTKSLETFQHELLTMKNYLAEIEAMFKKGDIQLTNFSGQSIQNIPDYNKMLEKLYSEDKSSAKEPFISIDPSAPFDETTDWMNRGTDAVALYGVYDKVRKGFKIIRYETASGQVKFKVYKPELDGITKPKSVRTTKIYEKSYIEKAVKTGNHPKVAKYVHPGSGAISALKSKAGWLGVALSTGVNIKKNVDHGEDATKIIGDAAVDVGIGAVSLAAGGIVAGIVGAAGAPVLVGAALAVGASIGLSLLFDGIKIKNMSISDHIKSGVQTIARWFKKK